MSLFDWLFGKKPTAPSPDKVNDDIPPTGSQPVEGPPEFVRAVEMQRAYWTHNAEEQARLEGRGFGQLTWRERLRLHHLLCLQRLKSEPERATATERCGETTRLLIAADSPY